MTLLGCRVAQKSVAPAINILARVSLEARAAFIWPRSHLHAKTKTRSMASEAPIADPFEKYKAKLQKKAEEAGLDSIELLKQKVKASQSSPAISGADSLSAVDNSMIQNDLEDESKIKSPTRNSSETSSSYISQKSEIKDLDSYVDAQKLGLHNRKEIEMIWKLRHSKEPRSFCGIIEADTFGTLYKNARKNPTFILPLPRENGAIEIHLVQWSFVGPNTIHCMFTSLAEYKLHQEYARPHTTFILHTQFVTDKGIVLTNGAVEENASLDLDQAHLLVLNLQRFYGANAKSSSGKRKTDLLYDFTAGSENFSIDKLIEEAETLD